MYSDGSYTVINIPEKQYMNKEGSKISYVGVADKKTVFSVVYRDPKKSLCLCQAIYRLQVYSRETIPLF